MAARTFDPRVLPPHMRDANALRKIVAMIEMKARAAREDPGQFFEFVMRDEKQRQVKIASHQEIALDFIMRHQRSVNIWPVNHSKTFLMAALTLWLLGTDPTTRGAIISATQDQAAKPLAMVSDYILTSKELRVVFPHLRPSTRVDSALGSKRDPWTQTAITVDRPRGIRDASLRAIGYDGAILGSRLDWIIIDDVLTVENTHTDEQRKRLLEWIENAVFTRLEPGPHARIVVMNTPWHPEDLVHVLERRGWPTMRMSCLGDIRVQDDLDLVREAKDEGRPYEFWDHAGVRMRTNKPTEQVMRLTAHDPDPLLIKPLWPERFNSQELERRKRATTLPAWNRSWLCDARSDDEAFCKNEYIELCKANARKFGVHGFVHEWKHGGLVFTGVDLAFKEGDHHDLTAFFTFAIVQGGYRQILDIETGRWPAPKIVEKIIDKARRFDSIVTVEDNQGQSMMQKFVLEKDASIAIRPYTTTSRKAHPEYGVASVFIEMANGAWLIPNTARGEMNKETTDFANHCLNYVPEKHTADILMAQFFAREQAAKWGALSGGDLAEQMNGHGSIAQAIMDR